MTTKVADYTLHLCLVLTSLVGLATLASFGARWWWPLELACHFRVQYAALLALAGILLVCGGRRTGAFFAFVLAGLNVAQFGQLYWSPAQSGAVDVGAAAARDVDVKPLRLLLLNVNGRNRRYEEIQQLLQRESPDVAVLIEYTPALAEALNDWKRGYAYRRESPQAGAFGIAILSRVPVTEFLVTSLGDSNAPTIVASLETSTGSLTLIGTHPVPPMGFHRSALRNRHLVELAELVNRQAMPVIVAGDLNITSYSPFFHDLLRSSGLRDSRQGFGIDASWPRQLPPLRIPIDHCLVSPEVVVLNRHLAGFAGSDHAAVVVDMQLR